MEKLYAAVPLLFKPKPFLKSRKRVAAALAMVTLGAIVYAHAVSTVVKSNAKAPLSHREAKTAVKKNTGAAKALPGPIFPTISYSGPLTYTALAPILPIPPTTKDVGPFGYNNTIYNLSTNNSGSTHNVLDVALDHDGNLLVAHTDGFSKVIKGTNTETYVGNSYLNNSTPGAVTVDTTGNVYFVDLYSNQIKEVLYAGYYYDEKVLATFSGQAAEGLAVDQAGNLYFANSSDNTIDEIAAGQSTYTVVASGFTSVAGLGIDINGNVYAADPEAGLVKEIPANHSQALTVATVDGAQDVAVDGDGNLIVSSYRSDGAMTIIPAGGGTPMYVGSGLNTPFGVVTDSKGAIYIADSYNNKAKEIVPTGGCFLDKQLPNGLSFNTNTGGISGKATAASPTTTYTVTVYNGIATNSTTVNVTVNPPPLPSISYSGPQVYNVSDTISPLSPVKSYIAAPGYYAPITINNTSSQGYSATGADGTIYLTTQTHVIDVIKPDGTRADITLTYGSDYISGVAADAQGNIYFNDNGTGTILELVGGTGSPVTFATGLTAYHGVALTGLAIDGAGNLYVSDKTTVKKIAATSHAITNIASGFAYATAVAATSAGDVYFVVNGDNTLYMIPSGSTGATAVPVLFTKLCGVTANGNGDLLVTDNNQLEIIPAGTTQLSVIYPYFRDPGTSYESVSVDKYGNILVADYFNLEELKPAGGFFISPGLPLGLNFNYQTGGISGVPQVAAAAANYNILTYNATGSTSATLNITVNPLTIRYTTPVSFQQGVTITPLTPGAGQSPPAYGGAAGINTPANGVRNVAIDAQGTIYATIGDNTIKQIPVSGFMTVYGTGYGFINPYGIVVDAAGDIFISDQGDNTVKELAAGASTTTTLASGFNGPKGIALDGAGDIFVADAGNNAVKEIFARGYTVITVGTTFSAPSAVSVDAAGNVFVAEYGTGKIKEIPATGGAVAIAIAGFGFTNPSGVSVDAMGNLFVSDYGNKSVSEIIAGTGRSVPIGTGYLNPTGVAVNGAGVVAVADNGNAKIKRVRPSGGYFIDKTLPTGLIFDTSGGNISGNPTIATLAQNYKVTAYYHNASASATLKLNVFVPPPVTISYNPAKSYLVGSGMILLPATTNSAPPGYFAPALISGSFFFAKQASADPSGNVYVAGASNGIQKIPAGGGTPVTLSSNSTITTAAGIAADGHGNLYITDSHDYTIKKMPAAGGSAVTLVSGLNSPGIILLDASGNLYFADKTSDFSSSVIEKVSVAGGTPVTVATFGPSALGAFTMDASGNIYALNNGTITKIIPSGGQTVLTGVTSTAGIACDQSGNLYTTSYTSLVMYPAGGGPAVTMATTLQEPTSINLDGAGNIYVCDVPNMRMLKPNGGFFLNQNLPQGLSFNAVNGAITGTPTAAGAATNYTVTAYNYASSAAATVNIKIDALDFSYTTPNNFLTGTPIISLSPSVSGGTTSSQGYLLAPQVLSSGVSQPFGVAADPAGNVYFSDRGTNVIDKLPANGAPMVTLGSGFSLPCGIAADAKGNVFVADENNSAIKKILANGGATVTLGSGFSIPFGVAVDSLGNIYVADFGNNAVKKMSADGNTIVTLGSGFVHPQAIAVDYLGNVYVSDLGSQSIKKIPADGSAVVTVASGLDSPYGIATDAAGNIYFSDLGHNAVDEIYAGTSTVIGLGSGFHGPNGLAIDGAGNLYIADEFNNVVKKLVPGGGFYINPALPAGLSFNAGTGVISGKPTTLSAAKNYTVTGWNSYGGNNTTVNIGVSANATLSSLIPGTGSLSPTFAAATTSYSVNLLNAATSITFTPTLSDPLATVSINGAAVISGTASAAIPLNVGVNTIPVIVTARDGVTTKTYTVTVTRVASSNANLASIGPSITPLNPVFAPNTTSYTLSVPNTTTSMTVKPVTSDANATLKVNGTALASGTTSAPISLAVGANTISVVVTAQNGTVKTYNITVTRTGAPNANLASMNPQYGPLSPVFNTNTTSYTESLANSKATMTVAPVTSDPNATIKVNGTALASGATSAPIPLAEGTTTTINVVVTAQDGVTTKTYSIVITRGPSSVGTLANLSLSAGVLSPAFATATTGYTVSEVNSVPSLTVTPTGTDANAAITVNGVAVASGAASGAIALAEGGTTNITVAVTSQDGTANKIYNVAVSRAPSSDATLAGMNPSVGPLSPAFYTNTTSYALNVANSKTSITVAPVSTDANAVIKVNGTVLASGSTSAAIALAEGTTTNVNVIVTSQDGTAIKTYTIAVTRAPSTDASLASMNPQYGPLSPVFNTNTTSYTESLANTKTSMTVAPVTTDANAKITVNGTAQASGATSAPIPLAVGANTISVIVTAQDGTTKKTYTIIVTRASGGANVFDPISVNQPENTVKLAGDDIKVHQGISPNGDGVDDFLQIDNISQYPDNKLTIMNRNGQLIFEAKGYDNQSRIFDGHSNKTGKMQLPGTYFYELDYTVNGAVKHKTGFIVLKY